MEALILEACVESFAEATSAQQKGAQQIELCDRLDLGGTTPPYALIRQAKDQLSLNVKVMIRPRGGNFIYTSSEIAQMQADIRFCKSLGIYGVVFGILTPEQELNLPEIKTLAQLAAPMQVTIHRAVDETKDLLEAVRQLSRIPNVHCILSSGGAPNARLGAERLREMVTTAKDQLTIIPAGKITAENLPELHKLVGSTTYHGTKIVGPL